MSARRLLNRVPSATKLSTAVLRKHDLKFHKKSNIDNTAKCDASETGHLDHYVIGVVFDISKIEKLILDKVEGLGRGYELKNVNVELLDGSNVEVFTYYATHIDTELKPFHWYKDHVLIGARENQLPEEYIKKIEIIESISDPDLHRHQMEMAIYL